jgi:hypothetical protein
MNGTILKDAALVEHASDQPGRLGARFTIEAKREGPHITNGVV